MYRNRKPRYPDDTDYLTNAPSFKETLDRFTRSLKILTERMDNVEDRFQDLVQEWASDGTLGDLVEKGSKGDQGDPPKHEWNDTRLRFENPDGSWGDYTDLQGERGEKGSKGDQGEKGDRGDRGLKGEKGDLPHHEWIDTRLRFENPDGTWGNFTDLQGERGEKGESGERGLKGEQGERGERGEKGDRGDQGERGEKGEKGDVPDHEINDMGDELGLRFEKPDGSWGEYFNIQGEKGDKGDRGERGLKGEQGEKGDPPKHEWNDTRLRFENPDGSWGDYTDLKGEKGDKGDQGVKGDRGDRGLTGSKGDKGDPAIIDTLSYTGGASENNVLYFNENVVMRHGRLKLTRRSTVYIGLDLDITSMNFTEPPSVLLTASEDKVTSPNWYYLGTPVVWNITKDLLQIRLYTMDNSQKFDTNDYMWIHYVMYGKN